jgi:hypothetical protein
VTKKLAIVFLLGFCSPVLLALYAGGETVAQAGLRLAAIESGFRLAAHHWEFDAVPAHQEPVRVVQAEPEKPTKKGRR